VVSVAALLAAPRGHLVTRDVSTQLALFCASCCWIAPRASAACSTERRRLSTIIAKVRHLNSIQSFSSCQSVLPNSMSLRRCDLINKKNNKNNKPERSLSLRGYRSVPSCLAAIVRCYRLSFTYISAACHQNCCSEALPIP
jgi:hypothetical protein